MLDAVDVKRAVVAFLVAAFVEKLVVTQVDAEPRTVGFVGLVIVFGTFRAGHKGPLQHWQISDIHELLVLRLRAVFLQHKFCDFLTSFLEMLRHRCAGHARRRAVRPRRFILVAADKRAHERVWEERGGHDLVLLSDCCHHRANELHRQRPLLFLVRNEL